MEVVPESVPKRTPAPLVLAVLQVIGRWFRSGDVLNDYGIARWERVLEVALQQLVLRLSQGLAASAAARRVRVIAGAGIVRRFGLRNILKRVGVSVMAPASSNYPWRSRTVDPRGSSREVTRAEEGSTPGSS